jgi:hypothetical protein
MIEGEWTACTDPVKMLEFLRDRAGDRKLLLFAVACLRQAERARWLKETASQKLEMAERYADGETTPERPRGLFVPRELGTGEGDTPPAHPPRFPVEAAVEFARDGAALAASAATTAQGVSAARGMARVMQCHLLRCLFGTPFRPVSANPVWPTWHGGLLVSMARRMYDSRDFSDLPVLADALEEAGCEDQDILSHCRSGCDHFRGCWVIDLLLGKS